ncbi:MAG: hypothetical protein LBR44_12270 [Clostridiales Family XIII bacterium]|jgi:pyruvate,water dikinase|nr:hypothetical protein [Clostridiales Family XIII bacterium]
MGARLGAKAENLRALAAHGFRVPPFIVLESPGISEGELAARMDGAFPPDAATRFAVRSSSSVEDAAQASYAGQFTTFLRVPKGEVPVRVRDCFAATESLGLRAYASGVGQQGEEGGPARMAVIVQEMVESELSGVVFTANPQGVLNEMVIVAGAGTGDLVVEDKAPVCTVYYNRDDGVWYSERQKGAPALPDLLVAELARQAGEVRRLFGYEADIEFAVAGGEVYLLQCRPITTLPGGEVNVLDNSNLTESYPGITLPLTDSFIRYAYAGVMRGLLARLAGGAGKAGVPEGALDTMVVSYNGRMYYRINLWYRIISLLPFSRRIFPVWERSLGLGADYRVIYPVPPLTKLRVAFAAAALTLSVPRKMERLGRIFAEADAFFRARYRPGLDSRALLALYEELSRRLFPEWDVTLANDLYAFLYTGRLQRKASGEEANAILSDVKGLASMEPVAALEALAREVREQGLQGALAALQTDADVQAFFAAKSAFSERVSAYIDRYGDRYLEELKLESPTYRTDPLLLIRQVERYAAAARGDAPPAAGRCAGEARGVRGRGLSGTAERAKLGIRNREISRLNRTRIYGMVRTIFLDIGGNLAEAGALGARRDVFWLTVEEVRGLAEGGSGLDARAVVGERKRRYAYYETLPQYHRVVLAGPAGDFNRAPSDGAGAEGPVLQRGGAEGAGADHLAGTPCSPGVAEAEAVVVLDPMGAPDTAGKILVAVSTDPGWVFLLAQAAGIIAERGSLLSHTAIVSRELHVPSVVGVENATKHLRTGDRIRLDGRTGRIEVLARADVPGR